jgi:NADH:ubiquinone oxidoreductase subunit E
MGTACYVKGAQTLMNALKEELKIDEGETTPDGVFTIKSTRCVGACGLAPILVANEDVHGKISPGEIKKIIQTCRKGESVDNKKH